MKAWTVLALIVYIGYQYPQTLAWYIRLPNASLEDIEVSVEIVVVTGTRSLVFNQQELTYLQSLSPTPWYLSVPALSSSLFLLLVFSSSFSPLPQSLLLL